MQIEIDLSKLERGTHEGRVKVTRGGKTFWRKQRVGVKESGKEIDADKKITDVTGTLNIGMEIKYKGTKKTIQDIDQTKKTINFTGDYTNQGWYNEYKFSDISKYGEYITEKPIPITAPGMENKLGIFKQGSVPDWESMPKTIHIPKSANKHFDRMMAITEANQLEVFVQWSIDNDTIVPGEIGIGGEASCKIPKKGDKWSNHHTHPGDAINSFSPADIWAAAFGFKKDPNAITTMQDERTKTVWVTTPSKETYEISKTYRHKSDRNYPEEKALNEYVKEQAELRKELRKKGTPGEEYDISVRRTALKIAEYFKIKIYYGMLGEELKQYNGEW